MVVIAFRAVHKLTGRIHSGFISTIPSGKPTVSPVPGKHSVTEVHPSPVCLKELVSHGAGCWLLYILHAASWSGSDGAVKPGLGILSRKSAVALGSGAVNEQEAELFKDQTLKMRKQ